MKILATIIGTSLFALSYWNPSIINLDKEVPIVVRIQPAQNDLKSSMARGKLLYDEACITCHLGNGQGVKGTFPPLAKADYLLKQTDKSIAAVKYGLKGKITVNGVVYNTAMASLGLDDQEVADVMNYILNSWGNKSPIGLITTKKVASIKQ